MDVETTLCTKPYTPRFDFTDGSGVYGLVSAIRIIKKRAKGLGMSLHFS